MPENMNIDLSAVDAAAEKYENEAAACSENEEVSTGHKVLFYIFLGALCLLGVGVPVLVFILIKKSKENKKLKEELKAKEAAPAEDTAAADQTEAPAEEAKAETKPEPEKEDKKKK